MFYIYIIYSESADRHYVGHTNEPARRLEEHNTVIKNSHTFKFRPWVSKACFEVSESSAEARRLENYIKRMKSRKLIEKLIDEPGAFGEVIQLVRAIPTRRD